MSLYHPLKIGNRETKGNILMAPLAGYTDRAFRDISTNLGADLCYTEMVSCEALTRGSLKTKELLEKGDNEARYAIQIFAGKIDVAAQSIPLIEPYKPLLIDLNCGCPVPKINKSGAGSALMQNPDKLADMIKALCDQTEIPITVKIRTGWDLNSLNYKEVAHKAIKAGAKCVTMHGRTRSQGYSGTADWSTLKELKESVLDQFGPEIPILGSGDMFDAQSIEKVLRETGIDGVMVARGAIGNPFVFREVQHFLKTGELLETASAKEKMEVAFLQLKKAVAYKDEKTACNEMKKQMCAYTKGLNGSSEIRNQMVHSENFAQYERIFKEYMIHIDAKPV